MRLFLTVKLVHMWLSSDRFLSVVLKKIRVDLFMGIFFIDESQQAVRAPDDSPTLEKSLISGVDTFIRK